MDIELTVDTTLAFEHNFCVLKHGNACTAMTTRLTDSQAMID